MSAQAAAKAPEPKDDAMMSMTPKRKQRAVSLSGSLRIWRQVAIAELLNLLEKRRYDSCK